MLENWEHDLIRQECELQHATSPAQIYAMTRAYEDMKLFALQLATDEVKYSISIASQDVMIARLIEPRNRNGYRTTPVVFANGGRASNHRSIPLEMKLWADAIIDGLYKVTPIDADDFYYVYETIHPYEDGNGRLGWLWWMALKYLTEHEFPKTLPPDLFSNVNGRPIQTISAFGEVER